MLSGSALLAVFIGSLALIFWLIIRARWDAFLALLAGAIVTGLVVGIPINELPGVIATGFGNTLSSIGITIGLGVMLGELLFASGAMRRIADTMVGAFGEKRSTLAVGLTGWLVSIPVFFDAAFVILIGLIRQLSQRTRISMVTLVTALAVGLIATHSVVPPTPGPLVVAENLGVDLGLFILYGAIVTLVATLVGGWLYGTWIGRNAVHYQEASDVPGEVRAEAAATQENAVPTATLSFGLLALPIVLILLNTIMGVAAKGTGVARFFAFIGEKNIALFVSVILASVALKPYFAEKVGDIIRRAVRSAGMILLVTGAGGSFGRVITTSGIGDYLVKTMTGWHMPVILLAFLFSQILRMAQGSTTVALVTTSSVLGPLVASLGVSPLLVALAICAGGIGLSMPNDSGFWVVNRFAGFDMRDTLRTWTAGGTIAGVVSLIVIYILSAMQGILPGI